MSISVNGYGYPNYPQRNLKAQNPSFGASMHIKVVQKAAKYGGEAVDKFSQNICGSRLPHVLTSTFLGAYYLKNKETGAKIEVDAPSKKQGTTIEDTLSDADKKLLIMELFKTENNELVQKIASDKGISANLRNFHKISQGEHSEILGDLTSKLVKDDYESAAAMRILAKATPENIKYAPMIMENVNDINYESAGDALLKINDETSKAVIDLLKTALKNDYRGVLAKRILAKATPENIKYAPMIMENVNARNYDVADDAIRLIKIGRAHV